MLVTILIFIAVLFVLVMVHEYGHFLAARKCGVKVDEFGFGIPPRVFGWRRKDSQQSTVNSQQKYEVIIGNKELLTSKHTLFSLNWLPIGGFVKIKGENEETPGTDSFSSQNAWKRILILSSGVVGNILLAFLIFFSIFSFGSEAFVPDEKALSGANVSQEAIKIVSVSPGSPADQHGILPSDILSSIDNQQFSTVGAVRDYIQSHASVPMSFRFIRRGETFVKEITPAVFDDSGGKQLIGIQMVKSAVIRYPVHLAFVKSIETTGVTLVHIVNAIGEVVSRLMKGEKIGADIAGPVGIAVMTGQAARLGFLYILQFTALLSLNLAFINIIPFPALDGGRILFIILEKIRRKKMRTHIEQWANNIGFSLLLLLILWVTIGDVTKLQVVKNLVESVKNLF